MKTWPFSRTRLELKYARMEDIEIDENFLTQDGNNHVVLDHLHGAIA